MELEDMSSEISQTQKDKWQPQHGGIVQKERDEGRKAWWHKSVILAT
jgi:hypothetical protein